MTVTEYCSIVDSLSTVRLSLAARGVGVAARAVEPFQHGAILARYTAGPIGLTPRETVAVAGCDGYFEPVLLLVFGELSGC